MSNNYKVYCLTNKINGKKYIGITRQEIEKRWKNGRGYKKTTRIAMAIKKYGWDNFDKKILYNDLDNKKASDMEVFYINKYNTTENGYNVQSGGFKDYTTEMSEYHKQCVSKANKGKHYSPETEFKKGYKNEYTLSIMKPVLCVETGIIYESMNVAEKTLGISHHIFDCIKGKRNKCGGYHWKLVGGEE